METIRASSLVNLSVRLESSAKTGFNTASTIRTDHVGTSQIQRVFAAKSTIYAKEMP